MFYLLMALGGALWLGGLTGRIGIEAFLDTHQWWLDLALGLIAGAGLLLLWEAARRLSPSAKRLEAQLAELLGPLEGSEVLGLALLSGFAEELFFRGAMQAAWGWLPATALFALLHAGPGASYRVWTLFAAAAGLTLSGLMAWRENLLSPVVAHVIVNAVNLGRLVRGPQAAGESGRAAG